MAIYLNGVNSYLKIPYTNNIVVDKSITIVFKINMFPDQNSNWVWLLNRDTWANSNYYVLLDTNRDINFGIGDGTNYYSVRTYKDITHYNGLWVVCRYDYDAGVLDVWHDGSQVASNTIGSIKPNTSTASDLIIGQSGSIRWFHGCLCNLIMYNRAISDDEIRAISQYHTIPDDGKIVDLRFNENEGVVCKDHSGLNNHAYSYNCRYFAYRARGIYYNGDTTTANYPTGVTADPSVGCTLIYVGTIFESRSTTWTPIARYKLFGFTGDNLMLYCDPWGFNPVLSTYDTSTSSWKGISTGVFLQYRKVYTVAGMAKDNVRMVSIYSNGRLIASKSRTDIVAGAKAWSPNTISAVNYPLHGICLACLYYDRVLTDEELEYISDGGWNDPPRDGLKVYIRFDKKKEGDKDYDEITGAEASYINGTPTFVIRKPVR